MKWISGINIGLKSFVVLRIIVTTVLLCPGAIIYFGNGAKNEAFFLVLIVAAFYFLSLLYLLLHPLFPRYSGLFKVTLVAFDLILASAVVYITGGKSSPFIFLYALIIIFTGMIFNSTASYIAAGVSGFLYLLVGLYHLPTSSSQLLLASPAIWNEKVLVYASFNLSGFLLIAILVGYLSERIRITRQELGESAKSLMTLKNLHENILQSLTSGVITLDLEGRVISINKTGLEILEISGENEVLLRNLNWLMPGIETGKLTSKKREQMLYTTPDGRRLTLGFSSSVLRDGEGQKKGYIIIFQDLTEIKELESRLRTSEKLALLGQLSAGLAHEIRNPLSAISGSVEILSEDIKPTEENIRLVRVATQEVERLNLLVEDFLLLTVPIQQIPNAVDVGLNISETVESFMRTVRRNGLEIVVDIQKEVYVKADSYRLKQAIWNLLLNSMQAMPKGGRIIIQSYLEEENIQIKVSDNGSGIDEKIMSRIFEPFFTTKKVGTGLGLAIVQKVIEGYNGKIDVISSEGEGTTFVMTLPKAKMVIEEVNH
jgi:two-component system sensor histidine kinase PilS (NtrC family)